MYGSKMKSEETDHLFEAILSLKDLEECYRFFDDLCTFPAVRQGLSSFLPLSLISRAVKRLSVVKSYRKKQK